MTNIYLDIETIPSQADWVRADIAANITCPGNYSKPESIAKWEQEIKPSLVEEALHKTGLDGAYGQIVCIGFAVDDEEPVPIYSGNWATEEKETIRHFFDLVPRNYDPSKSMRPVFVGHNIGFDLRFILQRAMVHGIKPTSIIPFNVKPWDDIIFDTMIKWAGVGKTVSLDKLCKVFGLPPKGSEIGEEMDGSKVWEFVKAGRITDVAKYCAADVERVRQLHKLMTFQ
jgi:predicted PolB exonuclease-like 3'-5' exonuclease